MNNFEDHVKKFQKKGTLKVINGSILTPNNAGLRFVLSFTNTAGKPESPLFNLFDKRWKQVKTEARSWYVNKTGAYKLGAVNTTAVQSDTWVVHLLCQDDNLNVNLPGLETCLKEVLKMAKFENATIHVSSLLLKSAPELKDLTNKYFVENGVNVVFYNEQ